MVITQEQAETYFENDIRNILFQIGKEIKLHRIDSENMVIDINYEKYVKELIELFDRQTR